MNKPITEFYRSVLPEQEIERLRSFEFPDQVSITEIGEAKNLSVVDVGVGSNTKLEEYITLGGGKYFAADINRRTLLVRKSTQLPSGQKMQTDAKSLPIIKMEGDRTLIHERFLLMNLGSDNNKRKRYKNH